MLRGSPLRRRVRVNTAQDRRSFEADQADAASERRIVETKTEARQGVTGHGVRYVLGWSLAAVVVAFALVYFFTAAWH